MPNRFRSNDSNVGSRRQRRITAIGDLNSKIKLLDRDIKSPFEMGKSTEGYTSQLVGFVWAKVETLDGLIDINGVENPRVFTHEFTIRYRPNISQLKWIEYKNQRYDILRADNLDERDEFILLSCARTGTNDSKNEASW